MKNIELNTVDNQGFETVTLTELKESDLKEVNGGLHWIVAGAIGAAIYEVGKHFTAWLANPFNSNENRTTMKELTKIELIEINGGSL